MRPDLAAEGKFQWLARLGFLVRGLLYIVIALLVLGAGRAEGLTGAIEYLASGFGRWMLVIIAVGMSGYGAWRLSDAAFGMDSGRHNSAAVRRRIGAAISGCIYLLLAYKSFALLFGGHLSGNGARHTARATLGLPTGQAVLFVAALMLIGGGFVQLYKAWTCSFLRELDDRAREASAKWIGRIGYAARGIVFIVAGYLLVRSAIDANAAEAGGLGQALHALASPIRYAVAAGLALFGLYSILEARFRSVHRPPVEHLKNKLEQTLAD